MDFRLTQEISLTSFASKLQGHFHIVKLSMSDLISVLLKLQHTEKNLGNLGFQITLPLLQRSLKLFAKTFEKLSKKFILQMEVSQVL